MSHIVTGAGKFIFYIIVVVIAVAIADFYWYDIMEFLGVN